MMISIEPCSSSMIGSMPNASAEDAFGLLGKYPLSIPAWCQLPKRSFKETMIPQYCEGFPGITIDEENKKVFLDRNRDILNEIAEFYENFMSNNIDDFAISEDHSQGLHYFINSLKNLEKKVPIAKCQISGPFTFGLGLNDSDMKPVWFDPEYKDVVLKGLTMKAIWQIRELKKYAEDIILFLDEPIMSALGTPAYMSVQDDDVVEALNEIIEAAHEHGATVGVHCCGNMDWGLLTKTKVDIIAFDAYFYGEKIALYRNEITDFLKRGGYLAWGIVPTAGHTAEDVPVEDETCESLSAKLTALIDIFTAKNIPGDLLRKQMILTPSCGMGTMTTKSAESVLRLLSEINNSF